MKRRMLRLYLATILITLAAVPAIAQMKTRAQGSMTKNIGTLSSIAVGEKSVTITLAGGETIIAPAGKVKVIDQRGGRRKHGVVSSLSAGQKVVVKTRLNRKGEIRSVRVKITG